MTDITELLAQDYLAKVKAQAEYQRVIDKLSSKTISLKIRIKQIESDVLLDIYNTARIQHKEITYTQEEKEAMLWTTLKSDKQYLDAVDKLRRADRRIINIKFRLAKAAAEKSIAETRLK